jgi:type II secretory pathway component PulF
MSVFEYQALQADGQAVNGELQAQSRSEVYHKLDRENLQPVYVRAKGVKENSAAPVAATPTGPITLSKAQVILFTEELSDLLEAGLQLEQALRVMENREEASALKVVTAALRQRVREGHSFSSSLRTASASFDDLYCNLVSAGEISGALGQIMRRQGKYLLTLHELQGRVISALIYPAFITGAGVMLMFLFMTVLVPKLTSLFSKTGKTMPFLTQMLISVSGFMAQYWWLIVGLGLAAFFGFFMTIKKPAGRRWWDEKKLKIPLFGPVMSARFYVQFCQTLATMILNGIPLLNGLRLMKGATLNVFLRELLQRAEELVAEGASLSRALKRVGHFPALLIDMIAVGEQTGDLGNALEKVGVRYDKELNTRIQRMTALIQPTIIVLMALMVGVVAYSMITGIFQAISGLKTHG